MASGGAGGRSISQEAFETMVRENMEDLGMDPDEALEDAIQVLTLQGVDLSGIVKCIPGITSANENPVLQALEELRKIAFAESPLPSEIATVVGRVHDLCSSFGGGSGNASIATKNGAVEMLCTVCSMLDVADEGAVASGLKALGALLHDLQSAEIFRNSGGPRIIVDIINKSSQSTSILDNAFGVVAAVATGNEILKESFVDLRIDEIFIKALREQSKGCIESLYDAICVLLTPDDNRVLASQVFGYARRFAQVGIADALVDALQDGLSSSSLVSLCIALKAVAVNDEICRSISDNGGIDATLQCIDDCGEQNKKAAVRACCSLLSKLASSDSNKSAIVQKGGLDRLIKLSCRFSDDPSVLQEIMPVICALSLRSPDNAAKAVEAGAGDMAIQAMQRFPSAYQMQKQSCLMIRNLVVRNPENRTILINNGIEKLIRKAKGNHENCKDAATDALRDLGLDDYNL